MWSTSFYAAILLFFGVTEWNSYLIFYYHVNKAFELLKGEVKYFFEFLRTFKLGSFGNKVRAVEKLMDYWSYRNEEEIQCLRKYICQELVRNSPSAKRCLYFLNVFRVCSFIWKCRKRATISLWLWNLINTFPLHLTIRYGIC